MRHFPEHLRDHVQNPRHAGEPACWEQRGEARNAACGDHVVVYLATEEGRVADVGFKAVGCPAAMGTASALCTLLEGLTADAGLPAAAAAAYEQAFGVPAPAHRHALALCTEALALAVPS